MKRRNRAFLPIGLILLPMTLQGQDADLITRERLLQLELQSIEQQQRSRQKRQETNAATVQEILKSAQNTQKSGDQQKNKGQALQGVGQMLQGAAMSTLAIAHMLKSKPDAASQQKGQQLDLTGLLLLTSALGSFTQALGAFGNSQGANQASQGAQQAAADRTGNQTGDPDSGFILPTGKSFDQDGDGTVTPTEVESSLGPEAQASLDAIRQLGPQGVDLKEVALNAMAKGEDPTEAIQQSFKVPIPASEEEIKSTLDNLKPNSQLLAESFHGAGLPFHDLLGALNNPDQLFSGEATSDSDQLSGKLKSEASQATEELKTKIAVDTTTNPSGSADATGGPEFSGLTSLQNLQPNLFNLDKFYSKDTDLTQKGFGKGTDNFLKTPGISHDPVKSIFEVMAQRYTLILRNEMTGIAYIRNGQLIEMRKRMNPESVQTTLESLDDSTLQKLHHRVGQRRIPTSLP